MELSVAERNLEVLHNLQPYEKLIIDEHGNMVVDSRYVQSIRRRITSDSKKDILAPLEETFKVITISDSEKIEVLKKVNETLKQTYPKFEKLHDKDKGLIQKLVKECQSRINLANTGKTLSAMLDKQMFELKTKEVESVSKEPESNTLINDLLKTGSPEKSVENASTITITNTTNTNTTNDSTNNTKTLQWNTPLNVSEDLSTFLNVPKTAKLTSKEIEYALHRYVLNNKLYKTEAKTIIMDKGLANLCGIDIHQTKEITNVQFKTLIFSKHVQKNI